MTEYPLVVHKELPLAQVKNTIKGMIIDGERGDKELKPRILNGCVGKNVHLACDNAQSGFKLVGCYNFSSLSFLSLKIRMYLSSFSLPITCTVITITASQTGVCLLGGFAVFSTISGGVPFAKNMIPIKGPKKKLSRNG
mmetsp:Transcript_5367/g.8463  ORF Transcript_5367/g.8463 Transcript_5367/m.8463 type:complete len:139 (+) Transcript_5367:1288-1704(+)